MVEIDNATSCIVEERDSTDGNAISGRLTLCIALERESIEGRSGSAAVNFVAEDGWDANLWKWLGVWNAVEHDWLARRAAARLLLENFMIYMLIVTTSPLSKFYSPPAS